LKYYLSEPYLMIFDMKTQERFWFLSHQIADQKFQYQLNNSLCYKREQILEKVLLLKTLIKPFAAFNQCFLKETPLIYHHLMSPYSSENP